MLTLLALGVAALAPAQAGATAALGWSGPATIDGRALTAISCPSESLCVAVDQGGTALAASNPTSPGAAWTQAALPGAQEPSSVSCPSSGLCVAVDRHGRAFATNHPLGGGWSGVSIDGSALTGVSCATESLCVAVDSAGNVLASTNPASPAPTWSAASVDPGNALQAVSCSPSECVAVDAGGGVVASANPAGGPGSWRRRSIDTTPSLTGVSCASLGCLAVDAAGNALASADPAAAAPTWSSTGIDGRGALTAASCASSGLCVAVGSHGEAIASDDPASAVPSWLESSADPGAALTGISCLSSGFCVAVDASGRSIVARVPPPGIAAAVPAEVTASTATLSGSVDPNDALLRTCAFEYGTSSQYGQSAPCASFPGASGGLQAVIAPISGLQPNTTYHYRLLASSATGASAGPDATFTTAVSGGVPLVNPHPSIAGTPAVGQRLTCRSGVPSGATAQLTYAWLRNLLPIAGATASTYTVRGGDGGHHLQCQVTARNAGGSATARSAFVTIPVQGVPASAGETTVGRARARGARLSVPVTCSTHAGSGCRIVVRVSVVETLQGGRIVGLAARARALRRTARAGALRRVRISIGATRARLARGQHGTISLGLNAAGRRLLATRHRLPALVSVSGTVIGVIESVLSEQVIQIGAARRATVTHGARRR